MMNMASIGTNETAAYLNDAKTLLQVLRETRERTKSVLIAERDKVVAQLAEIEAALVEVTGQQSILPRRPAGRPRGPSSGPSQRAKILHLIASVPGLNADGITQELGIAKPSVHAELHRMRVTGKIRREGEKGSYRYYAAAG